MYFCERGIRDGTRVQIYTCIIIQYENLDRLTHQQIAESHSFLPLSFRSLPIPFPIFLKYVYPHVLCCSRNNAVRVSHPRRTSLRNVSFVLLTNLPGPARLLALPIGWNGFKVEREKERKSKLVSERPRVHGEYNDESPRKRGIVLDK